MLELKELKNKYIEYSEEITEDIFNKILNRAKEFAREVCQNQRTYGSFDDNSFNSFRLNKFFRFSGENYSYGVDNNRQSANKIKVSDILGEETKFKVGKWYSFYWNWDSGYDIVAKVSELGEVVGFNNFINITQGSHLDQSFNAIGLTEIKNIKELTLEEIQQYLPDGHVDKIKTVNKWWLNLKPGDKIKCTEVEQDSSTGDIYGGCGWKSNEVFTVRCVDSYESYGVIFIKEHNRQGIFTNSCTPCSEPKPLTVDDLVEGEIYFTTYDSKSCDHIFQLISGDLNCCENFCIINGTFTTSARYFGKNTKYAENLRLATPEERKWLLTCIKQDKFIEQSELDKYDSEGNLIEVISKPETKEPKEMQLSDLKNPVFNIGDKVRVIADSLTEFNSSWTNGNNIKYKKGYEGLITEIEKTKSGFKEVNTWYYLDDNSLTAIPCNLLELVKPAKKEFDRNWYVEVNSQEEADLVFQYLESIGEVVVTDIMENRKYIPERGYKYIYYLDGVKQWFLGNDVTTRPQKQLSDILPNYSKVNRNVYYEVENQEQYLEILDWLESKGEFIDSDSRTLNVIGNWKYVVFNLSILDSWALDNLIPNLPKAEFQFKSKDIDMSKWEELVDVEATLSTYKYPITPEKCYKLIPETETEIKFISSEEEPQIEIPKLKVITNKIDLLTLKN